MLHDQVPLVLTVEEGNNLLLVASAFTMPDSLSEGQKYTNADRVLANMEVAVFYRALREHSPILRSKKRLLFFGPETAYEEVIVGGRAGRRMTDPDAEVKIHLDEMGERGLVWCLLVRLHPMSSLISGSGDQITIVWPIATKAGYVDHLREQIGLDKAQPKVIRTDRDHGKPANGNGNGPAAPAAAPGAPAADPAVAKA